MTVAFQMDATAAFDSYLAVRHRLPAATFGDSWQAAPSLEAIAGPFDLILLDAYGVLNVGETAIDGAVEAVAALRAMGKAVAVVSNSAGYPKAHLMRRFARLGFDFSPAEVVTSREALLDHLRMFPRLHWGVMLGDSSAGLLDGIDATILADDPEDYDRVDGVLLIGSDGWTDDRQALLEDSLKAHRRPVYVGNPDIVAPRENGLSCEPGHYAHRLASATHVAPLFFGKPFPQIYRLAMARQPRPILAQRVLMVGDTLHTDILGGRHMGFSTALVTRFGSLAGLDAGEAIRRSGIVPDFLLDNIDAAAGE